MRAFLAAIATLTLAQAIKITTETETKTNDMRLDGRTNDNFDSAWYDPKGAISCDVKEVLEESCDAIEQCDDCNINKNEYVANACTRARKGSCTDLPENCTGCQ